MSRPFSYNDENFTVIGNLLFVHFASNKKYDAKEPVLEVPYEIYSRLITYTNMVAISLPMSVDSSYTEPITIKLVNKKPFIVFLRARPENDNIRYHYCIYLLKDI